jgi:hypothetical protein
LVKLLAHLVRQLLLLVNQQLVELRVLEVLLKAQEDKVNILIINLNA